MKIVILQSLKLPKSRIILHRDSEYCKANYCLPYYLVWLIRFLWPNWTNSIISNSFKIEPLQIFLSQNFLTENKEKGETVSQFNVTMKPTVDDFAILVEWLLKGCHELVHIRS